MLVTLEQALRHLKLIVGEPPNPITGHEDAVDVQFKTEQACEIVLDYIKDRESEWDETTAPKLIQAAVLIVLSDLWEHRAGSNDDDVFLSDAVTRILHRYRDPALA